MDKYGTIILVNEAWRAAANRNPPLHKTTALCEGANYLEILDKVKGLEKENARETASAIRDLVTNPGKNLYLNILAILLLKTLVYSRAFLFP